MAKELDEEIVFAEALGEELNAQLGGPDDDLQADTPEDKVKAARIEEIEMLVAQSAQAALDFYDEVLEERYVAATKYYYGHPFGDEEKGRSKVISTDVRDTVLTLKPNLMRIFLGAEKSVEFRGRGPEDAAVAKQMTDHTNYVVREENCAFREFNALFEDFLLRKAVVKWWWEDFTRVEEIPYSGLLEAELEVLLQDKSVEVIEDSVRAHEDGTYDVRVRRTKQYGCERYAAIPPEEVIYTPNARSFEDADMVGHIRNVPRDQLIADGIDEDLLDEFGSARPVNEDGLETIRREVYTQHGVTTSDSETLDESQQPVLYGEIYKRVDGDGDGIGELRLFKTIGLGFKVTNYDENGMPGEVVDRIPLAIGTMDLQAHTIEGLNNYDLSRDIQHIKSHIEREGMNSLGKAVDPKTFVSDRVNYGDMLAPDVKGIVRVRGDVTNAVYTERHEPVINHVLPWLDYFDKKLERRVGRTDGPAGLDADALQSTTKAAVRATLNAAQLRTEMIAVSFAEQIMRPLFKGLLELSVRHRNEERMIRLRNKYVSVDPRVWDATMDVHINVGLGQGLPEDRRQILQMLYAEAKEHILAGSPMFNYGHLRHIMAQWLELGGWTDTDAFIASDEEIAQAMQAAAQQPKQNTDPAMELVQIEREKLMIEKQRAEFDMMLELEKLRLENDRERDKISRDFTAKIEELKAKYALQAEQARIDEAVERDRIAQDADLKREQAAQAGTGV